MLALTVHSSAHRKRQDSMISRGVKTAEQDVAIQKELMVSLAAHRECATLSATIPNHLQPERPD